MPRTVVVFYQERAGVTSLFSIGYANFGGKIRPATRNAFQRSNVLPCLVMNCEDRWPISCEMRSTNYRLRRGRVNLSNPVFLPGTGIGDSWPCNYERGRCPRHRDRQVYAPQAGVRGSTTTTYVCGGRRRLNMARTKDALKILEGITGNSPHVQEGLANARINLEVAQMIYDARTRARLSQRELADLIGSKQSVIARRPPGTMKAIPSRCCSGSVMRLGQRLGIALRAGRP